MSPRKYPLVVGESETLDLVCAGASLARYGDGEFALARGSGIKSQAFDPTLSFRLREILEDSDRCLVGIPNIRAATPKAAYWRRYEPAAEMLTDRPYVSSFITRPDSAPWIDTPEYWRRLESLWVGQAVVLVRGSSKSLTSADLVGAKVVREIQAPRINAFSQYEELLEQIGTPERVLLCLGPTATVLAVDLCARGVHAVDLGHVGMFLKKHRRGEAMTVTEADKVAV